MIDRVVLAKNAQKDVTEDDGSLYVKIVEVNSHEY